MKYVFKDLTQDDIKNIIGVDYLYAAEAETVFRRTLLYLFLAACEYDAHTKLADRSLAALYYLQRSVISSEGVNYYLRSQFSQALLSAI